MRMEVSFCSPFVRCSCEQIQKIVKNIWVYVCACQFSSSKKHLFAVFVGVAFLSPLFYLFSFFKSVVYLTCFGLLFYSLSLSLLLWLFCCFWCEHVCVCALFYPIKKTNMYTVLNIYINMLYIFISFVRSFFYQMINQVRLRIDCSATDNKYTVCLGRLMAFPEHVFSCTFPYVHRTGSMIYAFNQTHTDTFLLSKCAKQQLFAVV